MKRFGIDIDGTVTCPSSIIPYLNEAFQLNLTLEDVKEYDLNPLVDIDEEEFAKWFLDNEPKIYANSPLASGAKQVLKEWESKHELYFISARGSYLQELTEEWFLENELNFHHVELIGSHDKISTAKKHKVDIFFEDKHDNAVAIHEECGIPVILFDTPYNRDPIPEGVVRVNSWFEAKAAVEQLLKAEKN
ncbi:hypothetical protein ACQCVH_02265 [Bacillus infantis]|uniref:hypothetical protein n=1 Tax=Bacillus infantis TaxID=324767 RepID=UPI003CEB91F9